MLATLTSAALASTHFRALGTEVLVHSPAADELGDEVKALVERYEARFSRFRADSELCRLSAAAGREATVSNDLFAVLATALEYWWETDGLFDPLILPELESAGYDRTFSAVPRFQEEMPDLGQPSRPLFASVRLVEAGRKVRLPVGARLDLGGIAKGWIIDRLSRLLSPHGPYLIDVGGDMAARGAGSDGGPGWLIAVADPLRLEQDLCWLRLVDSAVATSTTMRRRWNRGGRWLHHIVDPRSGAPAASDLIQVTVLAPTAVAADVYAKTALILGSEAGVAWLAERSLAALLVTDGGEVVRSRGWERIEAPMRDE